MTDRVYDLSQDTSSGLKAAKRVRGCLIIVENAYVVLLCGFLVARLILPNLWWIALLNNFTPLYFLPLLVLFPLAVVSGSLYLSIRLFTVGMIAVTWFAPYFFPKSSAIPESKVLRVATLNV